MKANRKPLVFAIAAAALGLVATWSSMPNLSNLMTSSLTPTAIKVVATWAHAPQGTDLQSLVPTPDNTQKTDGPTPTEQNGIFFMFWISSGTQAAILSAYKTALEDKGWTVTIPPKQQGCGGCGSVGWGSNGDAYTVFVYSESGGTRSIQLTVWPTRPTTSPTPAPG